jgi:hypothetical protein
VLQYLNTVQQLVAIRVFVISMHEGAGSLTRKLFRQHVGGLIHVARYTNPRPSSYSRGRPP